MSRFWPYVRIARPDHWFKNVFAVPGFLIAWVADPSTHGTDVWSAALLSAIGLCLTASSNYVINEWFDAPFDRMHPHKQSRPAARGEVTGRGVFATWLTLSVAGLGCGLIVSPHVFFALMSLWIMGLVYNVRPVRSKEHPYVDVLSEAVNNPIRLWVGWAATGTSQVPPLSLLLGYWMLGAYFMAVKRFAELREIGDVEQASAYRASFRHYTEDRLLVSIMAYAAMSAMFAGVFLARYRIELVLAVPMLGVLFAWYLRIGLQPHSAAITPERLYENRPFAAFGTGLFALCLALLVVDMPWVAALFTPTITPQGP